LTPAYCAAASAELALRPRTTEGVTREGNTFGMSELIQSRNSWDSAFFRFSRSDNSGAGDATTDDAVAPLTCRAETVLAAVTVELTADAVCVLGTRPVEASIVVAADGTIAASTAVAGSVAAATGRGDNANGGVRAADAPAMTGWLGDGTGENIFTAGVLTCSSTVTLPIALGSVDIGASATAGDRLFGRTPAAAGDIARAAVKSDCSAEGVATGADAPRGEVN